MKFIDSTDLSLSSFIHDKIKNKKLDKVLSKVNRGEVFGFILIPVLYYYKDEVNLVELLIHACIVTFATDRVVLFLKKKISRGRPFIRVMQNTDPNPDMRHSFPSAHAGNSMVAISTLVLGYGFNPLFFIIPCLAGIGRLITLHHFISDVIGGWTVGFGMAMLGIYIKNLLINNNLI